ncbi:YpmS family protein [Caldifermentibacillus hisashii]|uniref:YpmS family protein n=1 Tax=Caldifermentibacillus hisashii TaxID=996558 RepID=UPI001C116523|nr:YpmS family protein [Caldifermentibacillus hisashii]MBU5343808.1 YpmS family protein [Caldifermentibacillus hisashii]
MSKKFTWKTAFFTLLNINIVIIVFLSTMVFLPAGGDSLTGENGVSKKSQASLTVTANKQDLNILINDFIEKENADSPIDYKVYLNDEVELYGTLPVFDQNVEMKLTLEPKALENGDLILSQNTIHIGKLQLPSRYVMNFIKNNYHFPKWVEIFPNEKIIYIHLTDIKLKNQLHIHANTFDLKNDDISFSLLVY